MIRFLLLGVALICICGMHSNEQPTLKVGLIEPIRMPYFYRDAQSGEAKGAYIDILEHIHKVTGIRFEYQFLPQVRIRELMREQKLDVEPGIDSSWRQEPGEAEASVYSDVFYISNEVIAYSNSAFLESDVDPVVFKSLKPCSLLGFNLIPEYDKDVVQARTEAQVLKMLITNRCDFAVFPYDVIAGELKKGNLHVTKSVESYELRLRLAKKQQHLLPQINRAIRDLKVRGEIQKIMAAHH